MTMKGWLCGLAALILFAAPATAERVSDGFGVTEWEEWSFVEVGFWAEVAGDQDRTAWTTAFSERGTQGFNMAAVIDPDEWDDTGFFAAGGYDPAVGQSAIPGAAVPIPRADSNNNRPSSPDAYGTLNSQLKTPTIDISAYGGQTLDVSFSSSWRPEFDSYANQSASFDIVIDGVANEQFRWNSNPDDTDPSDGNGVGHGWKPAGEPQRDLAAVDENLSYSIAIPADASEASLSFNFFDGTNDWWWAIDNIEMSVGSTQVFFEDFDDFDYAGTATVDAGAGPIDEVPAMLDPSFPTYTQQGPDGWEITPGYTGPTNSWASLNGQTVSAPGINLPEPTAAALVVLAAVAAAGTRR